MGFHNRIFHSILNLALLCALCACAGVTSGGTGGSGSVPPVAAGPSPVLGGQNSLGGGNFAAGTGGNDDGSGDQGGAVPSTQESNPGIGGPCGIAFVVKVKILRNGAEQSCAADGRELSRIRAADLVNGDADTLAPPEDPPVGPVVIFNFETSGIGEPRTPTVPTHCGADGRWTTQRDDLHFFYVPAERLKCGLIQVKTHAEWGGGTPVSSNEFTGPPFSDLDESVGAIPIEVTLDLGFSKAGTAAVPAPATLVGQ